MNGSEKLRYWKLGFLWMLALGSWCFFALPSAAQRQADLRPQPPPDPVEAQKQGRALVEELLAQKPSENSTNSGVLKIRDAEGKLREIPAKFQIAITPTNWLSIYETAASSNGPGVRLTVV